MSKFPRCLAPFLFSLFSLSAWGATPSQIYSAGPVKFSVTEDLCGLDHPWSLAFLPDGTRLITERPGRLRRLDTTGRLSPPIAGLPPVLAEGQGGLLDVIPSPGFTQDRLIFFSFTQATPRGARTAVARARLHQEGTRLEDVQIIFAQQDDPAGSAHWGSRLAFSSDGRLFITLGDRYNHRDQAQNLNSHLGKIVRIESNGQIPPDNPFVNRPQTRPEIWSYGHRNVQGAAIHPLTGELWAHEHGPQGGDEVNRVQRGGNHGWPVITYGREYVTGFKIGEGSSRPDVTPPLWVWTPSIAPSGMSFYTGPLFPEWQGSLFVGALRGQMLVRLEVRDNRVIREERLLEDLGRRIRDVRQGPEGKIWLLEETRGCLLHLEPVKRTTP